MRKKKIIRLLRNADEKTVEQISRDYPGMTDAEREALFQRITQELPERQEDTVSDAECFPIVQESRFSRMFPAMSAAACLFVLCGTFAGLFWMKDQMPSQTESTESSDHKIIQVYTIGESYAAKNLTQSGTLWLTVTEADYDDGLYHVCMTLESQTAASVSELAGGEPELFMVDNFMAATEQTGDNWVTVSPCRMEFSGVQGELPYTIFLRSGEKQELELWYKMDSHPSEWMLVTGYSAANPYTVITMKED